MPQLIAENITIEALSLLIEHNDETLIDLFPPQIVDKLRNHIGAKYDQLAHEERVALAVAAVEGTVNHSRLCAIGNQHAADATRHLQNLVGRGLLEQTGSSRGAIYHIRGMRIPGPEDVFDSIHLPESSSHLGPSSIHLPESSIHSDKRNADGLLISEEFDRPFVDDLQKLTKSFRKSMEHIARKPREKRSLKKELMQVIIRELCRDRYIKLGCIAELVDRNPVSLRNQYLNPMKKDDVLRIAFPRTPNDPRQAYTLANDNEEENAS